MLVDVDVHDSTKNVKVIVRGFISPDDDQSGKCEVLHLDQLKDKPRGLRLDSIVWLIEEKAGLRLYWGDDFLLPMESRNSMRFDTPLSSPQKNWKRTIMLEAVKTESVSKAFFLLLDMDKQ